MSKKQTQKKKLVLLDAHAILHRAYHALPEFSSTKGEPTGALYGLSTMLIKIIADLKPDYLAACYDLPGPTYRHDAYDAYKAGRKKADDGLVSQMKRSYDVFKAFNIPVYSHPGFEADDMLGTIVEMLKDDNAVDIVIASGDMDTLQLVSDDTVRVYTLKKGIQDTILYNERAVVERFGFPPNLLPDFKGLRGDPSDNIIGIKGIGEKTASTLIQNFGTIENIYKVLKKDPEKIKAKGMTDRIVNLLLEGEDDALFSKMLATIRRDAPITFALPQSVWKDSFDIKTAEELFQELEFRTMTARLKETLFGEKTTKETISQASLNSEFNKGVSTQDIEEVSLGLWVLDSNITNPTLDDILHFAKTKDFAVARTRIHEEIAKRNSTFVYEHIEKPLIPIIKKMENRGVKVNTGYLKRLSTDYHRTLSMLEQKIWKEAGKEFNINSPKQLGEILFDHLGLSVKNQKKTSTGMKSTRESELEKMKDLHPIIPSILEYRELQKLLSTYIDNIPLMLDGENRLHTNLRQTGTTTGRMSSTNPNLQNIPIKTELGRNIRNAFISEEGFTLVAFDYSQIELRIAAILSGDPKFLKVFQEDQDIHQAVASFVFQVPPERVDKEMRRKAKVINFGILYGMGVNALRQNLGGTREEASHFYAEYFKRFTGLAQYLDKVKSDAERKGYTETLFGRRRYFEGLRSKIPYIRASAERMAINAPIQGTAADIIKLAMGHINELIEKEKLSDDVFMILQVHDELVFEIRDNRVESIVSKIRECMENALPKEKGNGVVCRVNIQAGPSWGEMKEL